MEQVRSIEEVLAEFRNKYGENNGGGEGVPENAPIITAKASAHRRRRGEYGFFTVIAVQAATALAIIALLVALKLLKPEWFAEAAEFLRAKMYI